MKHINLAPTGTIDVTDAGDPHALQSLSDRTCRMVGRAFLGRLAADLTAAERAASSSLDPLAQKLAAALLAERRLRTHGGDLEAVEAGTLEALRDARMAGLLVLECAG